MFSMRKQTWPFEAGDHPQVPPRSPQDSEASYSSLASMSVGMLTAHLGLPFISQYLLKTKISIGAKSPLVWLQNNIHHLLVSMQVIYSCKLVNYSTSHTKNQQRISKVLIISPIWEARISSTWRLTRKDRLLSWQLSNNTTTGLFS